MFLDFLSYFGKGATRKQGLFVVVGFLYSGFAVCECTSSVARLLFVFCDLVVPLLPSYTLCCQTKCACLHVVQLNPSPCPIQHGCSSSACHSILASFHPFSITLHSLDIIRFDCSQFKGCAVGSTSHRTIIDANFGRLARCNVNHAGHNSTSSGCKAHALFVRLWRQW